ncbi:hypothetical protein BREVNS_1430 [Brevinematales bacterium NS]|nr:hypothetical protein BREVNS_1430 [Brevinematales bacterium NS]
MQRSQLVYLFRVNILYPHYTKLSRSIRDTSCKIEKLDFSLFFLYLLI